MAYSKCPVCDDYRRDDIEMNYMTGERTNQPFSRATIERHMAHVTEPEALKIALGLSAATALASRLRHLESQATAILDQAMTPDEKGRLVNANTALKAMREVRATIELMGRVAGTLIDRVAVTNARPDLDDAIADALKSRGAMGEHDTSTDAPKAAEPEREPARRPELAELMPPARALGPGSA